MTTATWSLRVLAELGDDVRADLADSLATAIELHFDLTVTPADSFGQRGAGGWCDGVSIIDSGVILYRPTFSRRENFTLMHELGHHLIDNNIDCLAWIADQPDPPKVLEQLCDQIAADLLISRSLVDQLIGQRAPDASAVLDLYDRTQASRSACAIAIARRLPCDGFVLLIEDGADSVFFSARARDTRPYGWRNDLLPAGHPLRRRPSPARTLTWWPHPTGSDRREYFMSTASAGGWIIAVLAENNLFGVPGFHIPQQVEDDRGYDGEIACPCGYAGKTRMWPCNRCGKSECPRCGECDCTRLDRKRIACDNCFTNVLPHLIVDGLCDQCR
jgi:hypothetical protein